MANVFEVPVPVPPRPGPTQYSTEHLGCGAAEMLKVTVQSFIITEGTQYYKVQAEQITLGTQYRRYKLPSTTGYWRYRLSDLLTVRGTAEY